MSTEGAADADRLGPLRHGQANTLCELAVTLLRMRSTMTTNGVSGSGAAVKILTLQGGADSCTAWSPPRRHAAPD